MSGWDLGEEKKKPFSKPGCLLLQLFCNKWMFVSGGIQQCKTTRCSQEVLVQCRHHHNSPKRSRAPNLCTCRGFLPVPYLLLEYLELKWRTAADLAAACPKRHCVTRLCGCPFLKYNFNNKFNSCKFFFWCLVLLHPLVRQTHSVSWH